MEKVLLNEIRNYLDSFGDDEQLDLEDLTELFYCANTLLVRVLESEYAKEPQRTHVVIDVRREDLECQDYDTSNITEDDLDILAAKMRDYMLDEVPFWDALRAAADDMNIHYKEKGE